MNCYKFTSIVALIGKHEKENKLMSSKRDGGAQCRGRQL